MNVEKLATVVVVVVIAFPMLAAEWNVSNATELQNALSGYANGDTINLAAGVYDLTGVQMTTLKGGVHLSTKSGYSVTLCGPESGQALLQGDGTMPIIYVYNNTACAFHNIVFAGGYTASADSACICLSQQGGSTKFYGCILRNNINETADNYTAAVVNGTANTKPEFYNCIFSCNTNCYTGGTWSGGAATYIDATDSIFTNNYCGGYGGASYSGRFTGCTFVENHGRSGGALYTCIASNCVFIKNTAVSGGAASGGRLYGCTFAENLASSSGGAVCSGNYNPFTLDGCTFVSNNASNGGAICGGNAGGSASNCVFSYNTASSYGGAAYNSIATDCVLVENSAGNGGAMYNGSATNCIFIGNFCVDNGGAVFRCTPISHCSFTDNKITDGSFWNNGGGAVFGGVVEDCAFTNNFSPKRGGACQQSESILRCVFYGNTAATGAAVADCQAITDCEFLANTPTTNNWDAGVMCGGNATNCLFTGNVAGDYCYGVAMRSAQAFGCRFTANICGGGGLVRESVLRSCIVECNTNSSVGWGSQTICQTPCYSTLFLNNVSTGSATLSAGASPFYNCTIIGQDNAHNDCGALFDYAPQVLVNCIITGSRRRDAANSSSFVMTNCLWSTGGTGATLYNSRKVPADKLFFADPENGDYRPLRRSPAFNKGDQSILSLLPAIDAAGNPRLLYDRLDIGAFEGTQRPYATIIQIR